MNTSSAKPAGSGQPSAIRKLLDALVKHGTMPNAHVPELILNAQVELAVYEMRLAALLRERDAMKAFIRDLYDEYYPDCGDIDGAFMQECGEKHGILVAEMRYEACGDHCVCAEMSAMEQGVTCYTLADWLQAAPGAEQ